MREMIIWFGSTYEQKCTVAQYAVNAHWAEPNEHSEDGRAQRDEMFTVVCERLLHTKTGPAALTAFAQI